MEILYSLGTVVKVKEEAGEYTIIGYCPQDAEGKTYTYLGIPAALGVSLQEHVLPFNQESIEKVVFLGYSEEKSEKFRIKLGLALENQK